MIATIPYERHPLNVQQKVSGRELAINRFMETHITKLMGYTAITQTFSNIQNDHDEAGIKYILIAATILKFLASCLANLGHSNVLALMRKVIIQITTVSGQR